MTELSQETRQTVIRTLISKMNDFYILPDKAIKFDAYAHKKLDAGQYDSLTDFHQFANELTSDLQAIVGDRHLGVAYSPKRYDMVARFESDPDAFEPSEEQRQRQIEQARYDNNGFERVERLAGNIGYIKFNQFYDAAIAGETAIAAMNFVSHCAALIFDLRENGGGSPSMIQLISSYLFEKRTHLNNFYDRYDDKTTQFWTQEHVQGRKLTDIPVYVLTSSGTFSAAEEFTYNLKNLKRATIVGESTGGGGHPVTGMTLGDGFIARICRARAVNPITNDNWEGVGVAPDMDVPAPQALKYAHSHALDTMVEDAQSEEESAKLIWDRETITAIYDPHYPTEEQLQSLVGQYGAHHIQVVDHQLTYTLHGFPGTLTPLSDTIFVDMKYPHMHFEFITDDDGIQSLKLKFRNRDDVMQFPKDVAVKDTA